MIDFKKAIELRQQGKTYSQIIKIIGCSKSWCVKHLSKINFDKSLKQHRRKCDLSKLLSKTNEAYYWLGFLFADGHFANNGRLKIVLSYKDLQHLIKLQKFLCIAKLNKPILIKGKKYFGISPMHVDVIKKLIQNYNISSNKTENPCNLNSLSKNELFCLSIGFIDGDGCIIKVYKRQDAFLRVKCHNAWENNLKLMFPFAQTKINNNGYVESRITNSKILKQIKLKALEFKLPILERKWNNINL